MSHKRINLGKHGEEQAVRFLRDKGYTIAERNFRTRCGEIDIIAKKQGILIFVEVKTRKSNFLESPFAAVTQKKQHQISKVAQEYLSRKNLFQMDAQFDVISITIEENNTPQIEHLENAFDLNFGF